MSLTSLSCYVEFEANSIDALDRTIGLFQEIKAAKAASDREDILKVKVQSKEVGSVSSSANINN